jgi:hypothetical protein
MMDGEGEISTADVTAKFVNSMRRFWYVWTDVMRCQDNTIAAEGHVSARHLPMASASVVATGTCQILPSHHQPRNQFLHSAQRPRSSQGPALLAGPCACTGFTRSTRMGRSKGSGCVQARVLLLWTETSKGCTVLNAKVRYCRVALPRDMEGLHFPQLLLPGPG